MKSASGSAATETAGERIEGKKSGLLSQRGIYELKKTQFKEIKKKSPQLIQQVNQPPFVSR